MSTALPRTLLNNSRIFGNSSNMELASLIYFFLITYFNEVVYKCGPFLPPSKDAGKFVAILMSMCAGSSLNTELLCLCSEQLNGRKCEVMV